MHACMHALVCACARVRVHVFCHFLVQMKEMDQNVDTDLVSKWFESGEDEGAKADVHKVVCALGCSRRCMRTRARACRYFFFGPRTHLHVGVRMQVDACVSFKVILMLQNEIDASCVVVNVCSFRLCSHMSTMLMVMPHAAYRMCSHIECVFIQNVFSYEYHAHGDASSVPWPTRSPSIFLKQKKISWHIATATSGAHLPSLVKRRGCGGVPVNRCLKVKWSELN